MGPLFRYERRILLGTLGNRALFLRLQRLRADGEDPNAWIWNRCRVEPGWLHEFARTELSREPFFRQAREFIRLVLEHWRRNQRPALLPPAVARTVFNYVVAVFARRALRRGDIRW